MPAISYTYNDLFFRSQGKLVAHIRHILNKKYQVGQTVDNDDKAFLLDLLEDHHNPARKKGSGVKDIVIRKDPNHRSNRKFFAVRTDGTESNFSYMQCIQKDTLEKRFQAACREAVSEDVIAFKRAVFQKGTVTCPISEKQVAWDTCEVDHQNPDFATLVDDFILDRNIEIKSVEFLTSDDMGSFHSRKFKDESLRELFRVYHNERATMVILDRDTHKAKKRKAESNCTS